MAPHSRTCIFPRHQSEPQISHSLYQFILYIYIYIYIYIWINTHTHTHTYIISKLPTSFVVTILNYAYGSNHNIILYSCITYVPYFKKKLGSHNTILQKILKIPPFHACQEGATTRKMSLSGFLFKTERGYCIYQIANSEIQ